MGKKNKKEKKGKGKEKTELKTEKKAEKRSKKELAVKGEEDIEKLIAEFKEQDRKKLEVIEEKCSPPSPRCNISLVSHPEREELLMFGGEYFTGNKMFVYNDLFSYQIKKNEWLHISIPNAPPPRSAHQAVTVSHQGGQMWVFGGEFSSHTQSQFYHYKDLWLLHLRDKKWEEIKVPGGPSARSGHRMVALKKQLIVFGGFHDNIRDYKYYNDVYSFDLETYTWAALTPSGSGPSPRSACVLLPMPDLGKIVVYGGYSKERLKKDVDKGTTHTDMFALMQEKKREGASDSNPKWKWQPMKQGGSRPTCRSGMCAAVAPGNKAFLFGGVYDEEDDDEDLESVFFNELWSLDLEKAKWFSQQLRGKKQMLGDKKKRRKKKDDAEDNDEEVEEEEGEAEDEMEVVEECVEDLKLEPPVGSDPAGDDGIFKVTIAKPSVVVGAGTGGDVPAATMEVDQFWPSKRMNTSLTVRDGRLFMYGGIYEQGDKQLTLNDFYSLDIHKLDEWSVIIAEDQNLQVWQDSDSSDEETEGAAAKSSEQPDSEDDDSDESMEITFDDAPDRREGEGISDYFSRSQEYWVQKAREIYEEEGETITDRKLVRFAKEICEEACDR
ncbi:kelch domain-containing protein 4-like [Physella acuta]|uniref:kelch domain-containing protein 4-like n=1 Tax=Physella acuta TaxID=109671 RepID=UPI0027DAE59C|nr:kelch domain-containing protein 4-like [Physella acuta]